MSQFATVIGQYKILEKIGEGGMGIVYKAEHTTLEQIVALKSLPSALSSSTEMRERFIREAKIQAKLSHPNVVNLHNFFEHEGNFYLVMEFVDGETVESILRRSGLIPPERCVSIFRQVLDGIGYAHSKGITHRDIKPSNIMITNEGAVKITDFGIAKLAGDIQKTQTGVKIGTLWYMSPEQVRGQSVDTRTDIYSLGITLFEMVTGHLPFTGDSEYQIMKIIVEREPPSPKDFYPYIPAQMENAILKAVSKLPSERFQFAGEFMEALLGTQPSDVKVAPQPYTEHRQISKPAGSLYIPQKAVFQDKRILWSVVVILMLAGVVLIYFGFSGSKDGKTPPNVPPNTTTVLPDSPIHPVIKNAGGDNGKSEPGGPKGGKGDKNISQNELGGRIITKPNENDRPSHGAGSSGWKKLKE
jgi:serine/threonine protein kinase